MGLQQAIHLAVARLRRLATPMFREMSLRRRLMVFFNIFFLIGRPLLVILIGVPLGTQAYLLLFILGGMIMVYTTRLNITMYCDSQKAFRQLLSESDKTTRFDSIYYYNSIFGNIVRMETGLLITYVFIVVIIGFFVLWVP